MAITFFTAATVYNDVENCLKGIASKHAYYVGGIKYNSDSYSSREGYIYVFDDWCSVSGDFQFNNGKCYCYYVPYVGNITKREVNSVDLSNLVSIHSNIPDSPYPAYTEVLHDEVIYRKTLELVVFVASLIIGTIITIDLFNFRR